MKRLIAGVICATLLAVLVGCAGGGGRPHVRYSVGYGGYYGGGPWGGYPRHPIYVGGGGGIPDIPDGPVAVPLPDFGMPDGGGMDFGGFDDF